MKLSALLTSFTFCLLCNEVRSKEACSGQSSAFADEINDYPQLRHTAYVISDLEDRIQKLKVKLDSLSSAPSISKVYDDIKIRLRRLEGTGCSDDEFQCGGNMRQCVSEMLACDGIKDCKNGKDEDPAFCDTSALNPPAAYTATSPMKGCTGGMRSSYFFRTNHMTIHRSKIYPPRLKYTEEAHGYIGEKLVMTVVNNGEYQSGTRRHIVYAPVSIGHRRNCVYPENSFDQAHCSAFKDNDQFPCLRHFTMHAAKPYSD